MLKTFNSSIPEFGEQEADIKREAAKDRALECILHTKILSVKILAETFTMATGEDVGLLGNYGPVDADTVEQMLIEKCQTESDKRDVEIASLKRQIKVHERKIQGIRDQINQE